MGGDSFINYKTGYQNFKELENTPGRGNVHNEFIVFAPRPAAAILCNQIFKPICIHFTWKTT